MQVTRLPLTHRWKVARAVENFLNKVQGSAPTDRALFALGDYAWDGNSPEGLPELMDHLIARFEAGGYDIRYMRETDYGRYDYLPKQLDTADSLNEGVDVLVNLGTVSNRSRLAGDFIQKATEPKWDMDWLDNSGPRPFVFFGPSCDIADFDRNAGFYDPILAELFLCADPDKAPAVAWISQGRGNWDIWYKIFAEEFVYMLFHGQVVDVLDCYWKTKQACWTKYPEMRNFLKSAFHLGWPVTIRGTCTAGVETSEPVSAEMALKVMPNPSPGTVCLRFTLPEALDVHVAVFDALGRLVIDLADQHLDSGGHQVVWSGRNAAGSRVAPGVYFARLTAGGRNLTAKMILRR